MQISQGTFDNYLMYKCVMHLRKADPKIADEIVTTVIESWVKKGYDSDELVELGTRRAFELIEVLSILKPELDNHIFLSHIKIYIETLRKEY
jgi:hypothetical protein